ncbi:MAG: hypothetical protein Q8O73_15985 [Thalassospira sp.]|nr:hypothetical protein [Thalassospira sp.]
MLYKTVLMAGTVVMSLAVAVPAYADSHSGTMQTDDAIKSDAKKAGNAAEREYEEAKEYGFEQKDDFSAWVEEKTAALGRKYDEVSAAAAEQSDETADDLAEAWAATKASVSESLDDVQDSSAETWENVKAGTVKALQDAERALSDDPAAQ